MKRGEYTPDPGTGHLTARFTRKVTLIPDDKPHGVYRDGAKVGEWPGKGYTIQVHGVMSAGASTLEAAKALGEHYGNESTTARLRHALSLDAATAIVMADQADRAAMMARYPFTPAEVESLKASRHHSDILEPTPPAEIARRIAQLSGGRVE